MVTGRQRGCAANMVALVLVLGLHGAGCVRAFNEEGKPGAADAASDVGGLPADGGPVEGGSTGDAAVTPDSAVAADAFVCPKACNKGCVSGVCLIECGLSLSCLGKVICPPQIPCEVTCGLQACFLGVDCTAASHCKINCSGMEACADVVTCGKGSCTVTCNGITSCALGVDCTKSCSCSVGCAGFASCVGGVKCPAACKTCGPAAKCGSC